MAYMYVPAEILSLYAIQGTHVNKPELTFGGTW